ncbi:hypothetical protein BAS06_04935 [Elizabethkingia miricola]|nr:hypothetical protein BAS06_04935 [Elizabethkingia miricola]
MYEKKLLKASLWGLFAFFLFYSCRTEENINQKNGQGKQQFAAFIPQYPGEKINYAESFGYLYQNYFDVNNINDNQKKAIIENFGTIDFRIYSQLFTDKEGNRAMIFPVKKERRTNGLVMAILENKGTNLRYTPLEKTYEGYSEMLQRFAQYDKNFKISNAIAAMDIKRPLVDGKEESEGGGSGGGGSTAIPGVIITVPVKIITIPVINPNNGIPTRPNGDDCKAYNGCERSPSPPGGGGGNPNEPKSKEADKWVDENVDDKNLKDNKCAYDVCKTLKSKVGLFNNLLGNFKGNSSILNLYFRIRDLPAKPGFFTMGQTNSEGIRKGYITVDLNPNGLGSTDVGIAKVYIHEMLHAKMIHDLVNVGWDGDKDIKEINPESLPTLLDAYKNKFYNPGDSQHKFMSEYYIPKIASALARFDNNNLKYTDYENLAWTGLQETDAYKALSKEKKDKITDANNKFNRKAPCGK